MHKFKVNMLQKPLIWGLDLPNFSVLGLKSEMLLSVILGGHLQQFLCN